MATADLDRLVSLRRELHRHPEPAWREFYTTARIVQELERIGVDELYLGAEALDPDAGTAFPDDPGEYHTWAERAVEAGAPPEIVDRLVDDHTGVVAVIDRGDGPHVGLRVDIDGLFREESAAEAHRPAAKGFRSENEGLMHACGHDGHTAIGLGVLEAIEESDFSGRLTVGFQPAEEVAGGGRALAEGGHFDDVEYLFSLHLGLGYETGTIVSGFDGFLAVSHIDAEFSGAGAHAGAKPEDGRNAIHALAIAVKNLYSITRHSDGLTRVNVGKIGGGTAANVIAERAWFEGEVRGGTTELRDFMKERAETVITSAAEMYDCEVDLSFGPEAPSAQSDERLAAVVAAAADGIDGVEEVLPITPFRASEDATFLMSHVQDRGGLATYVGIGTDTAGGHHTATFDVDERSLQVGVDVMVESIRAVGAGLD